MFAESGYTVRELKDSLRFYYLGNQYKNKVEHIGAKPGFDVTQSLIFSANAK